MTESKRTLRRSMLTNILVLTGTVGISASMIALDREKIEQLRQYPSRQIQVKIENGRGYNSASRQVIKEEPLLDKYDFSILRNEVMKRNENKILSPGYNSIYIPNPPGGTDEESLQ